jgi:hypothetical protein
VPDPHLVLGVSGIVTGAGDHTILTPPAGQSIRLFYVNIGAPGSNTATIVGTLRFGANTPIYTIPLVPGAIFARNIGAGGRAAGYYQQAQAADELMILSLLEGSERLTWSIEYLLL